MKSVNNKNSLYYDYENSDVEDYKNQMKKVRQKKIESFGKRELDVSDYIIAPEGWEGLALVVYFIFIPYGVGLLFLYSFIAGWIFSDFLILDFGSTFVVWAIGYEIVASLILFWILIVYLKFLKRSSKN